MAAPKDVFEHFVSLVKDSNSGGGGGGHSKEFIHGLIKNFFSESVLTNLDITYLIEKFELRVAFNKENIDQSGAEGVSIYEYKGTYIIYTYDFDYSYDFDGKSERFVKDHIKITKKINPSSFIKKHEGVQNDLEFVIRLFMTVSDEYALSEYMVARYVNLD